MIAADPSILQKDRDGDPSRPGGPQWGHSEAFWRKIMMEILGILQKDYNGSPKHSREEP